MHKLHLIRGVGQQRKPWVTGLNLVFEAPAATTVVQDVWHHHRRWSHTPLLQGTEVCFNHERINLCAHQTTKGSYEYKIVKIVLEISSWSHFSYNFTLNKCPKACLPVELIFSEFCTTVISDMTSSRVRCLKVSDKKHWYQNINEYFLN